MTPLIEVVQGDITAEHADAIVNAANATLLGGGGVDGAIHRAGGPAILEACRELRRTIYTDGLPTGWAAATTAGDLDARWVIHTVGPVYRTDDDPARRLAQCYGSVLTVADRVGARTVAAPAISTGAYGYPIHEAAGVAMLTVTTIPTEVRLVRFVLFDRLAFDEFERARAAAAARAPRVEEAPRASTRPVAGLPRPMPTPDPAPWGREFLHGIDDVLDGLLGFLDGF